VLHRGTRAAAGLLAVGAALLALTAVTMPGALSDYVHCLPANLHVIQVQNTYLWERQVTLKAFWRLLVQGRGPGETTLAVHLLTVVMALPAGVALVAGAWRSRRTPGSTDAVLAATIAAAPLLMPFYFDYDLLLLGVPAALVAPQYEPSRRGRWLLATGSALYLWLFVNPYVGGFVRFNLAVPLLCAVAGLLIAPLFRREQVAEGARAQTLPTAVPLGKAA
jgi:nitrogen fixation protein